MLNKILISYSSNDIKFVDDIIKTLMENNFSYEIESHAVDLEDNNDKIVEKIEACAILIVVVSPASLKSQWVPYEIGIASGKSYPASVVAFLVYPDFQLPTYLELIKRTTSLYELVEFVTMYPKHIGTEEKIKDEDSTKISFPNNHEENLQSEVLIAGQTCWDEIVEPSGHSYGAVGGSVYYTSKAIEYAAKLVHQKITIDVLAPLGTDYDNMISPMFNNLSINKYFITQNHTLQFKNQYLSENDWTNLTQEVIQIPDERISSINIPEAIKKKLDNKLYSYVLLLPLTPYDFSDINSDIIPLLKSNNPSLHIGLEVQGLLRDVPEKGGIVRSHVSDAIITLLKERAISCIHVNIKEGLFLVNGLANKLGVVSKLTENTPIEIALEICKYGVQYVGLTDGGKGSWIAWQSENGQLHHQHIPTPDITKTVPSLRATGAGDSWFGIFTYALFVRKLDPIIAGCLATQLATIKCYQQ